MQNLLNVAYNAVEKHKDMVLAAERYIWEHAESGYREWETHAYMKEKFESFGYTVTEMDNIPGFYADIDTGREGPCMGLFAEMDGLIIPTHPESVKETGAVHACGHHCQCAALLGVAAALKEDGALDGLCGKIRLMVVPAEELIEIDFRHDLQEKGIIRYMGGKVEFMYRGVLDGVDLAMMVHTDSCRGFYANTGSDGCFIKQAQFIGRGAHAGGSPHKGINALYAANNAMQAANALRETFRDHEAVRFHPIITAGGSSVNAIPDDVRVESYLRAASLEVLDKENAKLNRAFAGSAAAMGCRLELRDEQGYAPRHNDPLMRDFCEEIACTLLPREDVEFETKWATGCSDMGDVQSIMPAIHPYAGGAIGHSHSAEYFIDNPYLACVMSAKLQMGTIISMLSGDATNAKKVIAKAGPYPTIPEYLAALDKRNMHREVVSYQEDGSIRLL